MVNRQGLNVLQPKRLIRTSFVVDLSCHSMNGMESVVKQEGWVIKSPPLQRSGPPLFKARWRRRWFVLQGGKSGDYVLKYYSDESKRRLKGTISLDDCEQVDIGLTAENGRYKYEYMFDIRTPKRIYFLAVGSHEEMTTWVRMVCEACGLRSTKDLDGHAYTNANELLNAEASRRLGSVVEVIPTQPSSHDGKPGCRPTALSISSPYIHISTCYSGKPGSAPAAFPASLWDENKTSEKLKHTRNCNNEIDVSASTGKSSLTSVNLDETGEDSVFEGCDSAVGRGAAVNRVSSDEVVMVSKLSLQRQSSSGLVVLPPGRPPKPARLAATISNRCFPPNRRETENYANSGEMQEIYLFEQNNNVNGNSNSQEWNGPQVSRDLKPGRKVASIFLNGSKTLNSSCPRTAPLGKDFVGGHFATLGPPVKRSLKPKNQVSEFAATIGGLRKRFNSVGTRSSSTSAWVNRHAQLSSDDASNSEPGSRRNSNVEEQIYFYMPSAGAAGGANGQPPLMIPAESFEHPSLSYIDLDLPKTDGDNQVLLGADHLLKIVGNQSSTVYKTVDFVKTNAFNRTKREVESERYGNNAAIQGHSDPNSCSLLLN